MLDQKQYKPKVSVIIPVYNEERYIKNCLNSLLDQDFPHHLFEIIVVDGLSKDKTREIIKKYQRKYSIIRLIDNPKKIQSHALNIGIHEAKGKIIIRADAHVRYAKDYISTCVQALENKRVWNVGGVQNAIGDNFISKAVAIAITSPFGVGDASFRYTAKLKYVDSVFLGCWRKSTLESLGGFEEWEVAEDYELNCRIRKAGGKILVDPRIHCEYYARDSLRKLTIQYFRYGMWTIKLMIKHPEIARFRHLVPSAFILSLVISLLLVEYHWALSMIVPGLYLIANIIASVKASLKRGMQYLPLLPVVFAIIHLSWGVGFFYGIRKFGIPKISLHNIVKVLVWRKTN